MKKTLLTLAAALIAANTAFAQIGTQKEMAGKLQKQVSATVKPQQYKQPRKIELADNQLVMGGYSTDEIETYGLGVGNYATGTLGAYIYLPIDAVSAFDGGTVVKMRVGLAEATTVSHVYIRPVADGNVLAPIVSEDVAGRSAGWNEFTLASPVQLDFSGYDALLMGFDYNQRSGAYPLSVVEAGTEYYGLYILGNLGQGEGYYYFGNSYGNLSVQAVVEKDFAPNAATPQAQRAFVVPFGGQSEQYFTLAGLGKQDVKSIDYALSIDGAEAEERHADIDPVAFGTTGVFPVVFQSASTEKTSSYTLTINKVNGEENTADVKSVDGIFVSTTKQVTKRVAIEEFTGTGCQWCPRGYIGMEMLRKAYDDKFVGIAIHQYNSSDAMYIADYANIGFSGAPSCAVDRMGIVDPYYGSGNEDFGISQVFDYAAAIPALAGVEVSGEWNADSTKVTATAIIDGLLDEANYNVEFVLVGDSLTGTGSAWNQVNAYSQYTTAQGGEDMAPFCKGGQYGKSSVTGLYYNDVALASSYVGGTNQVGTLNVVNTAPATVSYELTLPTKAALRNAIDTHNLYVVALVIDPADGTIVNSVKTQLPFYVEPEQTLLEETVNVERTVAQGYTANQGEVDFTAAKEFLGVEEITTDMLRIENPDGELISDYATYDGWFNAKGAAETWSSLNAQAEPADKAGICVKFFQAIPDGKFEICDMNGADEEGKTYTVRWQLVSGEKVVRYTINVTFTGLPLYTPEIIKTIDVPVAMQPGVAYEGSTANFDVAEVTEALGIDAITDARQYIVNVTDGNFLANTTDGWRNAEGDAAPWGTGDGMVCVKINEPASGIIDYLGAIDTSYNEGDTFVAKWGFVNSEEKAAVVNVNITFTNLSAISDIDARTSAEASIYNLNGQRMEKVQKGLNIIGGKKVVKK